MRDDPFALFLHILGHFSMPANTHPAPSSSTAPGGTRLHCNFCAAKLRGCPPCLRPLLRSKSWPWQPPAASCGIQTSLGHRGKPQGPQSPARPRQRVAALRGIVLTFLRREQEGTGVRSCPQCLRMLEGLHLSRCIHGQQAACGMRRRPTAGPATTPGGNVARPPHGLPCGTHSPSFTCWGHSSSSSNTSGLILPSHTGYELNPHALPPDSAPSDGVSQQQVGMWPGTAVQHGRLPASGCKHITDNHRSCFLMSGTTHSA